MEIRFSHATNTDDPLPLSSLRLLVPPLRLMSAFMWQVAQQQDVMQYAMLAEFVSLVTETIPALLSDRHGAQLILGLRARLILELCQREYPVDAQTIQPHLDCIRLLIPVHRDVSSAEVEESGVRFVELVQTLLKDPDEREYFFQHVFPVEYGPRYNTALQTLMWEFLSRLELLLPAPDLLQTVSWLGSASSVAEDCAESVCHPEHLKSLLQHHKCLGHLDTHVSTAGDCILSSLLGRAETVARGNRQLNPPRDSQSPASHAEDVAVETLIVSEWAEVELGTSQDGEEMAEEEEEEEEEEPRGEAAEGGGAKSEENSVAEKAQSESREEDGVRNGEELGLKMERDYEGDEQMEREIHQSDPGMEFETQPDGGLQTERKSECNQHEVELLSAQGSTRRSPRKPKKTWKVKMVNLQTRKRKASPQKKNSSGSLVPTTSNRDGAETTDVSLGLSSNEGNTELTLDGSPQIFSCSECPFFHTQEVFLKKHMERVHVDGVAKEPPLPPAVTGPVLPHACMECDKSYGFVSLLKAHQRTHTGERPFQCSVCGKSFGHIQGLARHRRTYACQRKAKMGNLQTQAAPPKKNSTGSLVNPQEFKPTTSNRDGAETTDVSLGLSSNEGNAELTLDGSPQIFSCSECPFFHTQEVFLKKHMERVHVDGVAKEPSLPLAITGPVLPHACMECGKSYRFVSLLKAHQRTHTGERPFQCSLCGKSFGHIQGLARHRRTYACQRKAKMGNLQTQAAPPKKNSTGSLVNPQEFKPTTSNRDGADPADLTVGLSATEENTGGQEVFLKKPMDGVLKKPMDGLHVGGAAKELSQTPALIGPMLPHACRCGKSYRFASLLKAHQRTHTGERPFQCGQCGKCFSQHQALGRHRHTHASQRKFDCLYCAESFSSLGARAAHHKTHPEVGEHRCGECGKRYHCQSALEKHQLVHTEERPFKCHHCEWSFTSVANLNRHLLTHSPERPYRCSCGKGYTYRGALMAHQRTHSTERPYRCVQCGKGFLYKGALFQHQKSHSDEKPFLCSHCGKGFKRKRSLTKHLHGHTRESVFSCSQCDKTFTYKASLTRHELTHSGERPFLCSDCGKGFFSYGELLKHQRFHTGLKPFQCSHCEKSFTQSCYLTLHLRYHTGARPYTCTLCDKSFFSSTRLKRHLMIHTGEKPYQCDECGKKFRQSDHLKVHQQTHAGKRSKDPSE